MLIPVLVVLDLVDFGDADAADFERICWRGQTRLSCYGYFLALAVYPIWFVKASGSQMTGIQIAAV